MSAHLAGAALNDQEAVFAHCACLLGVCQGCTSVSALEMHIVSVVMIVCHVYMAQLLVPLRSLLWSRLLYTSIAAATGGSHAAPAMVHAASGVASRPPKWTGCTVVCMQSGCALPPAQQSSFGSIWQYISLVLIHIQQRHHLSSDMRAPRKKLLRSWAVVLSGHLLP